MTCLLNICNVDYIQTSMLDWIVFISNIDESTEDAITVVSDLLDFDKLTTGMLNIERGIHNIWNLISDTAKPFQVIRFHIIFVF